MARVIIREESGHLTGAGELQLFYRTWLPERPSGALVIVHGTNEHIGRYAHVAAFFAGQGLAVYGLDHRGYGQSQGVRGYINRFEEYVEDLRPLVQMAAAHGRPVMLGHSLGGLIAYRYGLAYPQEIAALLLSSPFFASKVKANPFLMAISPIASRLLPKMQVPPQIPAEHVSRDPEVVRAYVADPLNNKSMTPRWAEECLKAGRLCREQAAPGPALPTFFLQAADDLLVDPAATRQVFEQMKDPRKAFKLYPGRYHEILNDPGKEEVMADMAAWLREQELIQGQ